MSLVYGFKQLVQVYLIAIMISIFITNRGMGTKVSLVRPKARLKQFEIHCEGKDDTGDPEEQPQAYTDDDVDKELLAGPFTVETYQETAVEGRERAKSKRTQKRFRSAIARKIKFFWSSSASHVPMMSTATQGRRIHKMMMQTSLAERPMLRKDAVKFCKKRPTFGSVSFACHMPSAFTMQLQIPMERLCRSLSYTDPAMCHVPMRRVE